jgi:chromosome segregation ATPase
MNLDSFKQEILHNIALIKEYKKRLRVLERQAARFGPGFAPSHILVEIDEVRSILEGFDENVEAMRLEYIDLLDAKKRNYRTSIKDMVELIQQRYRTATVQGEEETQEEYRHRVEKYDREKREIDKEIGKLIKAMRELEKDIEELENQAQVG